MRGFPLPAGPFDRGHILERQAGGLEGVGINLVPQDSGLNRGRTRDGRRWRSLQQHAAAHPGTMCVIRLIYDDVTDIPAWFEVIQIDLDGTATVDRFPNRRGLP